jgi:hypothetical protein
MRGRIIEKGFEVEAEGSFAGVKDDVEANVPVLGDPEGPAMPLAVPGDPCILAALAGPAERPDLARVGSVGVVTKAGRAGRVKGVAGELG